MLSDDGVLPQDFASNYDLTKLRSDGGHWCRKFRTNFVKFGAYSCRINFGQIFHPDQADRRKEPLWSDIFMYYYYYFTFKLIVVTYNQFVFDYFKYRLDKFDSAARLYKSVAGPQVDDGHLRWYRSVLVADCEEARARLKQTGAPFIQFSIIAENVLILLIMIGFLVYIHPQLHFRRYQLDFSSMYAIIAPERLQKTIDSVIRERVNNYIASSRTYNRLLYERNYYKALAVDSGRSLREAEFANDDQEDRSARDSVDIVITDNGDGPRIESPNRVARNHRFFVGQVKSMAVNGMFQPFNRRCARLESMAATYGRVATSTFVLALLSGLLFELGAPNLRLTEARVELDFMDVWFQVELFIYIFIEAATGTFYVTAVVMACLDQLCVIAEVGNLINGCIAQNELILRVYPGAAPQASREGRRRSPSPSPLIELSAIVDSMVSDPSDLFSETINLSLLHTLMHYKVFVRQLRPLLDSMSVFTTTSLGLTFVLPVLSRLLIAYLNQRREVISAAMSVVILVAADLGLILVCRLHERCLDVYRSLQRLMAHTIEMDHRIEQLAGHKVYDEHLTMTLRRELNHPEKLVDQFAARLTVGQISLTYAMLLKHHFWYGIIIISIIGLNPLLPDANDVFGGVWRFYSSADAEVDTFFRSHLH